MPDLDCLEVRLSRLDWISESAEELSLPIVLLVFGKVVGVVLVVLGVLMVWGLESRWLMLEQRLILLVLRSAGLVVLVTMES